MKKFTQAKNHKFIPDYKGKLFVRLFLLLFIFAIFTWLILSTIDFVNLSEGRAHELPQWLRDISIYERAVIILVVVQLPYLLVALGLFAEFLKPNIRWQYNKDRFLTLISGILLLIGIFTLFWNWVLVGFDSPLYDTIIYGIGFGVLFLVSIDYYSIWLKILLWARLIEVWGPLIGYNALPAAFGRYTGGAFGHFGYGLQGMITSPYFLTDFGVQIFSVIGVMYVLKKAGTRFFWVVSFSIGAVIVGIALSYILPALF